MNIKAEQLALVTVDCIVPTIAEILPISDAVLAKDRGYWTQRQQLSRVEGVTQEYLVMIKGAREAHDVTDYAYLLEEFSEYLTDMSHLLNLICDRAISAGEIETRR